MRITELVKTYRLLNDPEAPNWSVKFVGALLLVAVATVGLGASYHFGGQEHGSASTPLARTPTANSGDAASPSQSAPTAPVGSPLRTDYVGYWPAGFDPTRGFDPGFPAAALEQWKAENPDRTIERVEPVMSGPLTIGHRIHHR